MNDNVYLFKKGDVVSSKRSMYVILQLTIYPFSATGKGGDLVDQLKAYLVRNLDNSNEYQIQASIANKRFKLDKVGTILYGKKK